VFVVLSKAASRKPRKPLLSAAEKAAKPFEREISKVLTAELSALQLEVPIGELAAATTEAEVLRIMDTAAMKATFKDLSPILERGAVAGAKTAALGQRAILDAARPRIKAWLRDHTAELVKETMGTSRAAIRTTMTAGVEMGRHPARLAKDIQSSIGLTDPQAAALARRRADLLAEDMPAARANELSDRYAEQLLEQRAKVIARNESLTAVNQGRAGLWQQLAEDGVMPAGQMQEWDAVNDKARCEACRSMHGQKRKVGEPFEGPEGEKLIAPPLHPQCRCVANLVNE
jgi:SPP1 gp7 family putative phage head morphogenesis protein